MLSGGEEEEEDDYRSDDEDDLDMSAVYGRGGNSGPWGYMLLLFYHVANRHGYSSRNYGNRLRYLHCREFFL